MDSTAANAPAATPPGPIVVTHRLGGDEAAVGEVALHPDLDALELAGRTELPLAADSGTAVIVHDRADGSCALTAPPGCLGPVAGGDLLALRWDGSALSVEVVPPGTDGEGAGAVAAALARVFAGQPAPVALLTDVLQTALGEEPELLAAPVAPLARILAEAGLEYYEGLVGPPGTDWAILQAAHDRQERLGALAATYGLSGDGLAALTLLVDTLNDSDGPGRHEGPATADPDAAEAAAALATEDGVAAAFLQAADPLGDAGLERVEHLAGRWLRAAGGRQRAAALWVQASCAELRGDQARQEQLLGEAVAAHPSYRPALQDSAWYASDRGQAGRAAALLGTAGVGAGDPWRRGLEVFSGPGPHQGPRNDPCKCGSGRKAKSCCLAANGWPIDARVPWLYDKALSFLHRPPQRRMVAEALGTFPDDALLQDLALFEGGVLDRFVEVRGSLLPSDERELAASWSGSRRRLCEVTEVRLDEGLVLEDLVTGEVLDVGERAATHHLRQHRMVFVRVLPDGAGSRQLLGDVMLVPFARHQGLLTLLAPARPAGEGPAATDVAGLARWCTAATAPPRLVNRDGELAVLGRAVFEVGTGSGATEALAALSAELEPAGSDLVLVGEMDDGQRVVRGRVRPSGRRLVVEANSAERLEHLLELVEASAPGLTLVDSVAVPLAPSGPPDHGGGVTSEPVAVETEELVEEPASAERMQGYEQRWVDQAVPALGGLSPRQAACDETTRRDLLRLLAEMEGGPTGMDAARVRALLDLPAQP